MTFSPIKTAAFALSTLALLVSAPIAIAQDAKPADGASLTLTFTGITKPTGAIMGAVYDSEGGFNSGQAVRGVKIAVTGASVSETITGLKPGRYGVKVYHDVDGDGQMGMNPFGIPLEPYAASNNARGHMGPPSWADAAFEVTADGAVQTITID